MADVKPPQPRDRAQLILVSGLTIAVTLVVLILLLNTTIYTENVATRGIDSDIRDAATVLQTAEEEIEAILAAEQAMVSEGDFDTLAENISAGIGYLDSHQANSSIERGIITDLNDSVVPGIVRNQSAASEIGDHSITNVEAVRTFELTINGSTLNTSENTTPVEIALSDSVVEIDATAAETIEINGTTGETCEVNSTDVTLHFDFLNGTAEADDGERCENDLGIAADGPPGDLQISVNDHHLHGSSRIVVGGEDISGETDDQWFVFAVDVEVFYRSPDLLFETKFTIPGEVP